jgi:hypothetical protein
MSREGRLVYVQTVMTASVIFQLLALDLDPWFFKAVDKLRRGFLWAGSCYAPEPVPHEDSSDPPKFA